MTTITIHQIEHAPHISLLKKISKADFIVLGDTMQYKKNYFENRNKIMTKNGEQYIVIPVEKDNHKPMIDIKISNEPRWKEKYLNSIKLNYSKTPHFNQYFPKIESIINKNYEYLINYNYDLLKFLLDSFHIKTFCCFLSDLDIDKNLKATDLLVEICKKMQADTYISGPSGKDYLELEKFEKNNIKVVFHEKKQGLSAIDYLFRFGGTLE